MLKRFMLTAFILICLLPSAFSKTSIMIRQGYISTIQGDTTFVSGVITENTTWTFEGSPYIITGDTAVDLDVFLTIEPGVTVKFTNHTNLIVDGHLTAHGNNTHKVIFTSNSTTPSRGDWGGINIREYSSPTSLEHIKVEYASTALTTSVPCNITDSLFQYNDGNVVLLQDAGNVYISNVQVMNNTGTGISGSGQNITIEDCMISDNGGGIRISGAFVYIENVTATKTGTGLTIEGASTNAMVHRLNVSYSEIGILESTEHGKLDIYNSTIAHNSGTGLEQEWLTSGVTVKDTVFINNTVGVRTGWRCGRVILEGCDIIGHRQHGIEASDATISVRLNNCRIIDNTLDGIHGGGARVHNSIISNNRNGVYTQFHYDTRFHNSTIQKNRECGLLFGECVVELYNSIVRNNPNGILGQELISYDSKIINNTIGVSADIVNASSTVIANNSLANIQPIEEGITCSMEYCDIHNSPMGLKVKSGTINFCNIYNHADYYLENTASNDINATYNWWSTTNETAIEEKIYDFYDNITLGRVFYKPYLMAPMVTVHVNVTSYPVTGIPFTINGTPQTTPYTEWLPEGVYTVEMPENHNGHIWMRWLEDGDWNRTKTFRLTGNVSLTGVFSRSPDLNQDGFVDMRDLGTTAKAYSSQPGDPNWNPNADINLDQKVSLMDLAIIHRHFGETWP